MPMGLGMGMGLSRPVVSSGGLGPEKVVNGSFATASDWALDFQDGDPPEISGGKLRFPVTTDGPSALQSDILPVSVLTYRTVFTIDSIGAGSVTLVLDGTSGTARSTAGTFTEDIQTTGSDSLGVVLQGSGFNNAVIDNVSVKQVL